MTLLELYGKYKHFLAAILVAAILFSLPSCGAIHRAEYNHAVKKENKLHSKFPTLTDSLLHVWFPPTTSIGTTDTLKDSTKYYQHLSDSLRQIKPYIHHIHDTVSNCQDTSDLFLDDSDNYNSGFNLGYKIGVYDGRSKCPISTITHDTTLSSAQKLQLIVLQKDTATKHDFIIQLQTQLSSEITAKDKWRKWVFILVGILTIRILIKVYEIYKSFQIPIKV